MPNDPRDVVRQVFVGGRWGDLEPEPARRLDLAAGW